MFLRYNGFGTWHLVKYYGFCVPDNPEDSYALPKAPAEKAPTLDDSLFEIAKARLYTEHSLLKCVTFDCYRWFFFERFSVVVFTREGGKQEKYIGCRPLTTIIFVFF